jgi:hypothetical protein
MKPVERIVQKGSVLTWSCVVGLFFVLAATRLSAQEDPSLIIEEKCAKDWPDNARMRAACIEQQEKVLDKSLTSPVDPSIAVQDYTMLREKCAKDWPDDFRMRSQCEKNQVRGFRRLQAPPPKDVTLKDYSVATMHCAKEWPDDFLLRARCLEEQLAAVRLHHDEVVK